MCFATADGNNEFPAEGLYELGVGFVRAVFAVFWEMLEILKTQLPTRCSAPSVQLPRIAERHRMRVTACQLDDLYLLNRLDLLWHRHERAFVHIDREVLYRAKSELPERASTKTIHSPLVR
jgi:hypothetical protein